MQARRAANRGGNWNNTSNAGVFNLNFNNPRSNSNTNIGGRPALPHAGYVCAVSRDRADAGAKGACFPSGAMRDQMRGDQRIERTESHGAKPHSVSCECALSHLQAVDTPEKIAV